MIQAEVGEGVDNRIFYRRNQLAHADLAAFQIDHHVHHLLARPVVGHLAAAIALDHRDIAGHQQVLGFAGLALGEDRVMLHQPQLVRRSLGTTVGEVVHGLGYRRVGLQPQLTQNDLVWLQRVIVRLQKW